MKQALSCLKHEFEYRLLLDKRNMKEGKIKVSGMTSQMLGDSKSGVVRQMALMLFWCNELFHFWPH